MARGRTVGGTVRVDGLEELIRDLTRVQKDLKPRIRAELKDVASIVADEAQKIATARGLVDSGKLVRSIRPGMSGSTALIRETANRRGFPYPALYEYGGSSSHPKRPFMEPAVARKQDQVRDELEKVVDRVMDSAGF